MVPVNDPMSSKMFEVVEVGGCLASKSDPKAL
jgi:hypothetical protein